MKNGINRFVCLLSLLLGYMQLTAEPLNVLMIGNSFTNGTAKVLEEMGAADSSMLVEWAYSNGKTLEWHYTNRNLVVYVDQAWTLEEKLNERAWDYIVLQDQSLSATRLMPTYDFAGWSATMIAYVRSEAPGARIGLFETWAYRSDSPDYSETFTPLEFQEEVRDKYRQAALTNGVDLIPIGEGFARFYRDNPYVWGADWKSTSLHSPDTEHANQRGYYLAAAAIYGVVTGTPFADASYIPPFDDIPAELRTWLRYTAWNIAHYPSILTVSLPDGWPGSNIQVSLSSFFMPDMPAATWVLAGGTLPPGLSLSGNIISGIPTQSGSYTFDIAIDVPDGEADFATYTMRIDPPPDTLVTIDVPRIDGNWWPIIAGPPDLGIYNSDTAEAVDFTIWQAEDGTWQLVSCIRNTAYPGRTRLFYRWEAQNLTDEDWTPMGIFAVSDLTLDPPHTEGRMQAPHCFKYDGLYYFFYNSYGAYCKVSTDGKTFTDYTDYTGSHMFFTMGRDLMIFDASSFDGNWYAYFLETLPDGSAYMAARTATDLRGPWSDPPIDIGNLGNPESPFAYEHNGLYYLWEQMKVYVSRDPRNYRNPSIATLWNYRYAPEILSYQGVNYMGAYSDDRIWLCRLTWDATDYIAPSEARLHQLEISGIDLDPAFDPDVTSYSATIGPETDAVSVFAIAADAMAWVSVDQPLVLDYGRNTITVTVLAQDEVSTMDYQINVVRTPPPGHPVPVIMTAAVPSATADKPYAAQLEALGGQTPYTWSVYSGQIPPGLSLGSEGAISGVPSSPGLYAFDVQVTDGASASDIESFTLFVDEAETNSVPVITAVESQLPIAWVGGAYEHSFPVTGGNAPLAWSLAAGALPDGLTLSADGILSGTPTQAGFFAFSVKVTDFAVLSEGDSATATFLLPVGASAPLYLTPVADAAVKFNAPGVNDGANKFLYTSGPPPNLTAYLKFDLSPMTGTAAVATLRAYSNKTEGSYTANLLEVADDSWTEMGIIPENAPATGALIDSYTIPASPGYYEWDVTGYLNGEYNGDGTATIAIKTDTGTTWIGWHARDHQTVATRPQLTVVYPVDVPSDGYWGWVLGREPDSLSMGPWDNDPATGINNLLRYALNIPAGPAPVTGLLPSVHRNGSGALVFSHARFAGRNDIVYIVQRSADLETWDDVVQSRYPDDFLADDVLELTLPPEGGFYRLTVEFASP